MLDEILIRSEFRYKRSDLLEVDLHVIEFVMHEMLLFDDVTPFAQLVAISLGSELNLEFGLELGEFDFMLDDALDVVKVLLLDYLVTHARCDMHFSLFLGTLRFN